MTETKMSDEQIAAPAEYCRGPRNDNYGYDPSLVAPVAQVRAAADLTGEAMWTALEQCQWVEIVDLPADALIYETSSVDAATLTLGRSAITVADLEAEQPHTTTLYRITASYEDANGVRVWANEAATLGEAYGRTYPSREAAESVVEDLRADVIEVGLSPTTEYVVEEAR